MALYRPTQAQCTGDIDSNGQVDVGDLLTMLGQWGTAGAADLDGDNVVAVTDLLLLLGAWGACPPSSHVIVVYNTNAPDEDGNGLNDALEIAQYYITARGLEPLSLCPVQLPVGNYATPDELLGARRTILEDCICALSPPSVQQSTGCSMDNAGALDAIRDGSPVTHMVLVRGIPLRLFDTGWPGETVSDQKGPSLGFYLSYLLNNDEDIFPDNSAVALPMYGNVSNNLYGYHPPLDPAQHRMLAYGRIEAITRDRTYDLIDRTLAAEAAGVQGNVLIEEDIQFLYDLTTSHDAACTDYLAHEPFVYGDPASSWPYDQCRVGSTGSTAQGAIWGEIPGEFNCTVPFAINAGLLFGTVPIVNKFSAFDGFINMRNWHKADVDCVEVCSGCNGMNGCDEASCIAGSTDYFGELNTDCVGVGPGFIAHQSSSFTVQQYGYWPPGWVPARGAAHDRSTARVVQGDAYVDGIQFVDDLYAHYGGYDHLNPDTSTCSLADGSSVNCAEHIAVNLSANHDVADVPIDMAKQFTLRFRYRYATGGLPDPALRVKLRFTFDQIVGADDTEDSTTDIVTLSDTAGGWSLGTSSHSIGPYFGVSVDEIRILMWSDAVNGVRGFLDLDGVELIDEDTQQNLLPVPIGSFSAQGQERTLQGDWAFNVIDRLGGIGYWGSTSHHLGPFSGSSLPGALFAGRTYGEAATSWASGMVFGDPLYQPSAAKIYVTDHTPVYQADEIGNPGGYEVWADTHQGIILKINAWHGQANVTTTNWELSTCPGLGAASCAGGWQVVQQGVGKVEGLVVGALADYIDTAIEQDVTFRLRVWNTGDDLNDLSNYAYFNYHAYVLPE